MAQETNSPSSIMDVRQTSDMIMISLISSISLIFIIPLISLLTSQPNTALLFMVFLFISIFLIAIYCAGYWIEGISVLVLTLSIISADIPLLNPITTQTINGSDVAGPLSVYLVDPFILILLFSIMYHWHGKKTELVISKKHCYIVILFALFLFSSLVSALRSGSTSSLIFFTDNLRLFFVFLSTISIVLYNGVYSSLIPFLTAIYSNLLFSTLQIISGGNLGPLTYFGEGVSRFIPQHYMGELSIIVWKLRLGYYPGGFVGHAREFNALLIIGLPFVISILISKKDKLSKIVTITLILLSFLHIFVSQSTTGIITAAFAVFGTAGLITIQKNDTVSVELLLSLTIVSFVVSVISSILLIPSQIIELLSVLGSIRPRIEVYNLALDTSAESPIFGIGGYNFSTLFDEQIHNLLLNHLVSTGLVGVLTYALAILLVIIELIRLIQIKLYSNTYLITLGISVLSFQIYMFWTTGYSHLQANIGFWIIAGTIVGLGCAKLNRNDPVTG